MQTHPAQRRVGYLLLFCALLLVAWFSYDYGRAQAPASAEAPVAPSGKSEPRITELERERDTLKQQIAGLEQRVKQANQALDTAQARIKALQQAGDSRREAPAKEPPGAAPEPADNRLKLDNVHIEPTQSENLFRIVFSVARDDSMSGRVTGTIWIAVNGFSGGTPRRLSLKTLSPDNRAYVKMGFDRQQDVTEEIVLPEDFRPKNILIEAKPYGDDYTGTSGTFNWATNG